MDLQLLRYFYTVAAEGSFLQAAHKLNYAQSNLSSRIKGLEEELGEQLFYRSSNGVTLTEKGRILYEYAEKLLSLAEETKRAMAGRHVQSSVLHIGAMESCASTFLPGLLAGYHARYPEIAVRVTTGHSAELREDVLRHRLDAAFVAGPSDHAVLTGVPVRQERMVILADSHTAKDTPLHALLSRPLLVFPYGCSYRSMLEGLLADENIMPQEIIEFSSLGAIVASVSVGLGISLLPSSVAQIYADAHALQMLSVPERYATAEIKLIYRSGNPVNLTLEHFLALVSENE